MKSILKCFLVTTLAGGFASCAEAARKPVSKPVVVHGSRFEATGRVSLHPGQPCTPQIMFDFRSAKSSVWLAAHKRESKILTEAARRHQRIQVAGVWRRAKNARCEFVDVTKVIPPKKFLGIFSQ